MARRHSSVELDRISALAELSGDPYFPGTREVDAVDHPVDKAGTLEGGAAGGAENVTEEGFPLLVAGQVAVADLYQTRPQLEPLGLDIEHPGELLGALAESAVEFEVVAALEGGADGDEAVALVPGKRVLS